MPERKIKGLLGLAEKAGKTASGEFLTEQALRSRSAYLTILAEDASAGTKKKFTNMCITAGCPLLMFGSKEELAHAMGKEMRSCVAILDEGLADAIGKAAERLRDKQGE